MRLGVRAGLNQADVTLHNQPVGPESSYQGRTTPLYSWQAGAVLEARLSPCLALQPALLVTQKGAKLRSASVAQGAAGWTHLEANSTLRYQWLELPMHAVYSLPGRTGLQLFGGPYAAALLGGEERGSEASYTEIDRGSFTEVTPTTHRAIRQSAYAKSAAAVRWDAGLNFGLGYARGPWQVQLGYGLGLHDMHRPDSNNTRIRRNRGAQLTATYFHARKS
ncbi:hypothetical protein GCM10027048_42750 [Hymenobacter coalescens]